MAAPQNDETADAEEADLVARCRAGDRAAFRDLYGRHFDMVHRMARRMGTPPAELDDVTQEVFASAFGKLHRFGGGNFGFWIHRICANVVNDHHRKRRVRETFRKLWRAEPEEEAQQSPSPEGMAART